MTQWTKHNKKKYTTGTVRVIVHPAMPHWFIISRQSAFTPVGGFKMARLVHYTYTM